MTDQREGAEKGEAGICLVSPPLKTLDRHSPAVVNGAELTCQRKCSTGKAKMETFIAWLSTIQSYGRVAG